jgi:transcriptional regulator with XRE-family HTH domain
MYNNNMRMSSSLRADVAPTQPRLRNKLPELLAASKLSMNDVAARVEVLTGARLDRRTLRRYLSGDPIIDSTAVTLAAICRALGVSLDAAVELVAEDPLELLLTAGGRHMVRSEAGSPPPGWGKPDPAWGELVEPFLQDRRRSD